MRNLTELITLNILDFKINQLNDCYTYTDGVNLYQLKPHYNDIAVYVKVNDDFKFVVNMSPKDLRLYIRTYKALKNNKAKKFIDTNTGEVIECLNLLDAKRLFSFQYQHSDIVDLGVHKVMSLQKYEKQLNRI